jgi:hypothetical protein
VAVRARGRRAGARPPTAAACGAGAARGAPNPSDVATPGKPGPASPPVTTSLPVAMWERVVLVAGGVHVTWGDVVDWMRTDGTWAASAQRASDGRALALAGIAGPGADALAEASRRFRRERRLTAGEDLQRWLEHWGISIEAWVDWLDHRCRLRAHATLPQDPAAAHDDQATWVDAVCSGELRQAVDRLARALGAWADQTGGAASLAAGDRWGALRSAYGTLAAEVPEPRELERAIATNAARWLLLALEWARFPSADAALEALACCRDDRATLPAVAALAGVSVEGVTVRAEDLDPRLRSVVVSSPLDVPVLAGGSDDPGLVMVVRARRHPCAEEPSDRELARRSCVEERVQAAVDRWVSRRA